jgi:hypothetical protein
VSAWPESRHGGGIVATALARAEAWLLEPPVPPVTGGAAPAPPPRPVVAVRGLAPRCGASTVARALAAALAREDPCRSAAVLGADPLAGPRMASPAAARLARVLAELGCAEVRPTGRVCLLPADPLPSAIAGERPSPIVIDVPSHAPPAEALGIADHVLLVGSPLVDRSLAAAVETSLARGGHSVDVVVNRVEDVEAAAAAEGRGWVAIGESRLAAQLALACRDPRGPFAVPVAELADRCRARAPR